MTPIRASNQRNRSATVAASKARGITIYFRTADGWSQRDSFHSKSDGSPNPKHVTNDTQVDRVLLSDDFVYFGGEGPEFPADLQDKDGRHICKAGIGRSKFNDDALEEKLVAWLDSIGSRGLQGSPFEWLSLREG
ncbi:hypothetical protein NKJ89_20325 [Mesorhizobium sp. M0047]